MASDVKWIKISTGLPGNKKLNYIRSLLDGDTIALMWVFLLCLAGDVNERGMIYIAPEVPYTDEMLAEEFRMDIKTIRKGLATFQKLGMIEIVDNVFLLSSWDKWQNVDGLEKIREQTRKRVASYRSRNHVTECNVTCNADVTHCNATEIEEDIELDKELEIEKEKELKDLEKEEYICASAPPKKVFIPPTVDKVTQYIREKGYNVDAEHFVAYYESNGWMVGRNKMKDWKAAVRTWVCKQKNDPQKPKDVFEEWRNA